MLLGVQEFAGYSALQATVTSSFCATLPAACILWLGLLCGFNPEAPSANFDTALLPLMMHYLPAGTSVQVRRLGDGAAFWMALKRTLADGALLPSFAPHSLQNMAHWSQAVKSKDPSKLSRYDLGTQCTSKDGLNAQPCNQKAYGTMTPPPYNLSAITTPLALFTGGKDSLSTPQDLELLLRARPTGVLVGHHIEPNYAHLDFGLGMDAHVRVFPSVVEWLKRFASGQVIKPAAVAAPGGAVV